MNLKYFSAALAALALTFNSGVLAAGQQMETAVKQRTLIILKPDAMEQKLAGVVLSRFEREGFAIVGAKVLRLDGEILRQHYAHLVDKPFFGNIVGYMTEAPVLVVVLEGDDAISRAREMVGPTDSSIAPKGTIRGDFGKDKSRNVIHASEDEIAADAEISRFFEDGELFAVND
jgi:nucleoside-diphosphate kinase